MKKLATLFISFLIINFSKTYSVEVLEKFVNCSDQSKSNSILKNISLVYNRDLTTTGTLTPSYLMLRHAPFSIIGNIKNVGSDTINYFTINYRINGSPIYSGMIDSSYILPNSNYTFSHTVPWIPTDTGTYFVNIWASNINGGADENPTNDNFIFKVEVLDTFVLRKTCIEMFTGTWCAPCHYINSDFDDNVLPNISNYTIIKYHMGADVFATWEGHNRAGYYGSNFVPDFYWDGQSDSHYKTAFQNFQVFPSFMNIDISDAHYKDSTVYVSGVITPIANYDTGAYYYQVAVIEKENSLHPNGLDTFYNDIQIRMSPNEFGTSISTLTAGTPIYFNHSIPIQISHVQSMSDLKIVVFVQNNNDKKVQQSAWRDVTFSNDVSQISEKEEGMTIFPNPANNQLAVNISLSSPEHLYTISLKDITGQQLFVLNMNTSVSVQQYIDVSKFAQGIYFITLNAGDEYMIKKFVKN